MAKYRRRELSREERAASALSALAVGAALAGVAYYVAKLFLSREELATGTLPKRGTERALPRGPDEGEAPDEDGVRRGEG